MKDKLSTRRRRASGEIGSELGFSGNTIAHSAQVRALVEHLRKGLFHVSMGHVGTVEARNERVEGEVGGLAVGRVLLEMGKVSFGQSNNRIELFSVGSGRLGVERCEEVACSEVSNLAPDPFSCVGLFRGSGHVAVLKGEHP